MRPREAMYEEVGRAAAGFVCTITGAVATSYHVGGKVMDTNNEPGRDDRVRCGERGSVKCS